MKIKCLRNVGVYHDSDTTLWHFGRVQEYTGYNFLSPETFLKSENLNEFVQSTLDLKFALYHVAFPCDNKWVERFHLTYLCVNHSIIVCSEMHENTVDQLLSLDLPNVTIFISGFLNHNFRHAKIYQWMDWFITAGDFYRYTMPNLLKEKLTVSNKEKYFDVLLGCWRLHRDFVYDYINHNMADKVIMTYFRRWNVDLRTTDHIFETEGLEFLLDNTYYNTVHRVKYYDRTMNLSAIVPIKIYNETYYSLVTETNSLNHFNFYTEKIVKPILAGRLFIVIAGAGYLQNLRSLGFKTFGNIIDESYDDEIDHYKRWLMALEQANRLCKLSPIDVKNKIKDVVEHNQKLMLEDWNEKFIRQLFETLFEYLTIAHIIDD